MWRFYITFVAMKLVFATNNKHKLEEARAILGSSVEVKSLEQLGCYDDIPETSETLEGNSRQKALYVWQHFGVSCFADDTGLEVGALGGAPGVYSARYAGEPQDAARNRKKLLQEMAGKQYRSAQFRTVVTVVLDGTIRQVEGIVRGRISTEERGFGGFGYDSIFIPEGYNQTFAELGEEIKNHISHRAIAMEKLKDLLADWK